MTSQSSDEGDHPDDSKCQGRYISVDDDEGFSWTWVWICGTGVRHCGRVGVGVGVGLLLLTTTTTTRRRGGREGGRVGGMLSVCYSVLPRLSTIKSYDLRHIFISEQADRAKNSKTTFGVSAIAAPRDSLALGAKFTGPRLGHRSRARARRLGDFPRCTPGTRNRRPG